MPELDEVLDRELLEWQPLSVPPFSALVERRARRVRARAAAATAALTAVAVGSVALTRGRATDEVGPSAPAPTSTAPAWQRLPDPDSPLDDAGTPLLGPVLVSTGGTGAAGVVVTPPAGTMALVLRLVCVSEGTGQVLDADGVAFLRVGCASSAETAAADSTVTVPVAERDLRRLRVLIDPAGTWRLSVLAAGEEVRTSGSRTWTAAAGVAAPPPVHLPRTSEFGLVRALTTTGAGLRVSVDRVDMLVGDRARAEAARRGEDPLVDDFLVDDRPELRTYPISPVAVVWGSIGLTGEPTPSRVPLSDWLRFCRTPAAAHTLFHFETTQVGVVVGIEEQYRP